MNIHCGVQQHKAQKKRQIELFVCRTHLTLSCPRVKLYCSEVAAWSLFHSNIDFVLRVYSVLGRKRNKHYKIWWEMFEFIEISDFWLRLWCFGKSETSLMPCLDLFVTPEEAHVRLLGTFSQKKHQRRRRRLLQNSQFALHLNLLMSSRNNLKCFKGVLPQFRTVLFSFFWAVWFYVHHLNVVDE